MKIEKNILQQIIDESNSKRECLEKLGLHSASSTSYRTLNYYLKIYKINVDHYKGYNTDSLQILHNTSKIPLPDILSGKHPLYHTAALKIRLLKEHVFDHKCAVCNNTEWMTHPIPLDLDHINGDSTDHRLENLRLLCRNCHAQTETFCGKNKKYKGSKRTDRFINHAKKLEDINIINNSKIKIVLNSNINFSKFGWVTELAPLIDLLPQKVNRWMKRWMPEFYEEHCYKRKALD